METWVRAVVEAIHSSRARAVIYLAGGASQALGWLLSVPGASGSVLEVIMPYSRASMAQLLGKVNAPPSESLCSPTREFVSCLLGELALDTRTNSLDGKLVLFVLTIVFQLPLQFTSQQAAEDMALAAFNRALKLSGPGLQVMGVGFTGSLASSRPKYGDHRVYGAERRKTRFLAIFCSRFSTCLYLGHKDVLTSTVPKKEQPRRRGTSILINQ